MLDKESIDQHINKAFAKKSWKQMSALLDEDLPVQKKANDKPIVILSILLLISSVTIGYLLFTSHQTPSFAELTKEKIIYRNVYVPQQSITQADDETRTEVANFINKNNVAKKSSSVLKKVSNTSKNDNINNNYLQSFNQNVKNLNNSLIQNIQPVIESDKTNIEAFNILSDYKLTALDYQRSLPSLEEPFVNFNSINKRKKIAHYKVSLITSAANNFDFTGYGLSTGLELALTKKMGFSFGLAYSELSRTYKFLPVFQKDLPKTNNIRNKPSRQINQDDFYSSLISLKQLYVPMSINYSINRVLSINSGLNFRYTYNRNLEGRINQLNAERELYLQRMKSSKTLEDINRQSYFDDTSLGLTAGVKLHLSKNVSFALDSEWGLGSMFNADAFQIPSENRRALNVINLSTNFSF